MGKLFVKNTLFFGKFFKLQSDQILSKKIDNKNTTIIDKIWFLKSFHAIWILCT